MRCERRKESGRRDRKKRKYDTFGRGNKEEKRGGRRENMIRRKGVEKQEDRKD